MHALLLALSTLVAAWGAAGQAAIRCTAGACFTLHDVKQKTQFDVANKLCFENGGHLLTMRDEDEAEDVRALLALYTEASKERLWIGLKLTKGNCVLDKESLRGFRWVSEPANSDAFASWGHEPLSTCTEERCVSVRATESVRLKWSDSSCKSRAMYACRFQFKGMCEPLALAGPGEVAYTGPFSHVSLNQSRAVRMLPHGTSADITCTTSDKRYFAICTETATGFTWTSPGPFCASGERSCAHQNGGCHHECSEDGGGGARCACRQGHYLGEDMFTCFRKDPCQNARCEHTCVVVGAGFRCSCPQGFRLAHDKAGCEDVDECEKDVCGRHKCHNTPGSYECACETGFQKDVRGACEDIDECAEDACGKHAKCLNSQGSFSCYCATGFRTSDTGGECVDVDECLGRPCEDTCTNTEGSFECSCPANFRVADNGISCIQVKESIPPHTSTSNELISKVPDQTTTSVTVTPLLGRESRAGGGSTEGTDSGSKSWMLIWVLGSVIPLLLLVALTVIIAVLRWNRARKDAKKKSASADSYCWVSSGFQIQPEIETR